MNFHFLDLVKQVRENVLVDEKIRVQYASIPEQLEKIESFFKPYDGSITCLGFYMCNTVCHVLVLLYLLQKRVNFFLLSPSSSSQIKNPGFVDYFLTISPPVSGGLDFDKMMKLKKNEDFLASDPDFQINSGVIFFSSSGSTGYPKYVCYKNETLLLNSYNCIERLKCDSQSRFLVPVPTFHMYGMGVGLLPALLSGGNICLVQNSNIIKLLDAIDTFKPSITLVTPALAKMMLLINRSRSRNGIFISAGEKMSANTFFDFTSRFGELINLYGSTEFGAIATSPEGNQKQLEKRESFLKALKGVEVQIRGNQRGEILCNHNASFECYVDDLGKSYGPSRAGAGWLSTKDIGEKNGNGLFKIHGRIDNCINRYGYLISLEEVESLIENLFPEFKKVLAVEFDKETEFSVSVVAICELKEGASIQVEHVFEKLKNKIDRKFLPDKIYLSKEIPRSSTGKVDKKKAKEYLIKNIL